MRKKGKLGNNKSNNYMKNEENKRNRNLNNYKPANQKETSRFCQRIENFKKFPNLNSYTKQFKKNGERYNKRRRSATKS